MKPRPNFFIIGAPKCGTTSLAAWLSEHPNVWMSPVKEPCFFCSDLEVVSTFSEKEYARLFDDANPDRHIAIGEASVWYLFSRVAVPRIENECAGSRYIVMVRNPVDMAHSLYGQLVFDGLEDIQSFERAWRLSSERREGRAVSPWCHEPRRLDYQQVCSLGEQLERLLQVVPMDRIHVVVLDDMIANPRMEYRKILDFLGLPDDGRTDFPVLNEAKRPRSLLFVRLLNVARQLKARFRFPRMLWLNRAVWRLIRLNSQPYRRQPVSPRFREELLAFYEPDIRKLGQLLGRDFDAWLQAGGENGQSASVPHVGGDVPRGQEE